MKSPKNPDGTYAKLAPPQPTPPPAVEEPMSGSLDDILNRQLLALERVTRQLVLRSSSGNMTRDEIQSLSTCIKVTLDLKAVESDILDNMTTEELEEMLASRKNET